MRLVWCKRCDIWGALQDVLLRTLALRLATKHVNIGSREIATLAWSLAKLRVSGKHAETWLVLEEIMSERGCPLPPPLLFLLPDLPFSLFVLQSTCCFCERDADGGAVGNSHQEMRASL